MEERIEYKTKNVTLVKKYAIKICNSNYTDNWTTLVKEDGTFLFNTYHQAFDEARNFKKRQIADDGFYVFKIEPCLV